MEPIAKDSDFFKKHCWLVADFTGDVLWYFSSLVCAAKSVDFWSNQLPVHPNNSPDVRKDLFVRHKDQQRWFTARDCRLIANGLDPESVQ